MSASVLCFRFRGKILHQQELFLVSPFTANRAASRIAPTAARDVSSTPAASAAARCAARASCAGAGSATGQSRPSRCHTPPSNTGINKQAKGAGA